MGINSGNWMRVGSPEDPAHYRRIEILREMHWKDADGKPIKLERYRKIVCACNAGPVAAWLDDGRDYRIETFTAAGRMLGGTQKLSAKLLDVAWSFNENLLCLYPDGRIMVCDIYGDFLKNVSFGDEVKKDGIAECRFFLTSKQNSGVVVLTNANKFYVIANLDNPRVMHVNADYSSLPRPSCWCFIPSSAVVKGHALLFCSEESVYRIDVSTGKVELIPLPWDRPSPLRAVVASPDQSRLAFVTASYSIIMTSANMKQILASFDKHKFKTEPKQLVWCSNSAVAAYWPDKGLLYFVAASSSSSFISPPLLSTTTAPVFGSSVIPPDPSQAQKCISWHNMFDTPQYFVTELDGLRSISQYTHEFIQEVPLALRSVGLIDSRAPGATLLAAYQAFEAKNYEADGQLRLIEDKLEEAVEQCIQTAPYETEPKEQKLLLRAAAFGKSFIDDVRPSREFYKMCQRLRVLNAIRNPLVGLPLTFDELGALARNTLIDRLVMRRHFPLAIEIANFLELPADEGASRVLVNWAQYKIRQKDGQEEQIAQSIIDKLQSSMPVPSTLLFADVAECAMEAGRHEIACSLLEYEPNPYKKVKLLLRLNKPDIAMNKAIASLDPGLVFEVVMHMKEKSSRQVDFYLNLTRNYPKACQIYISVLKEHDAARRKLALVADSSVNKPSTQLLNNNKLPADELADCYLQDDSHYLQALQHVSNAYDVNDLTERQNELRQASVKFASMRGGAAAAQLKELCDEQRRLWNDQRVLEEKLGVALVDLSLYDTLRTLIKRKQYKLADDMKKDYAVPDKAYWCLKIDELAAAAGAQQPDWDEFDRVARKAPLDDVYNACLRHGQRDKAATLISKLPYEQRIDACIRLGQLEQAVQYAWEKKDAKGLEIIIEHCPRNDLELAAKIKLHLQQLKK